MPDHDDFTTLPIRSVRELYIVVLQDQTPAAAFGKRFQRIQCEGGVPCGSKISSIVVLQDLAPPTAEIAGRLDGQAILHSATAREVRKRKGRLAATSRKAPAFIIATYQNSTLKPREAMTPPRMSGARPRKRKLPA